MEKQYESSFQPPRANFTCKQHQRRMRVVAAILVGTLVYYASHLQGTWFPLRTGDRSLQNHDAFSWETIEAKPYLSYKPCYQDVDDFQCARLEVPMDYWNGTTDELVKIAIIKKPASVPVTSPHYGGAILHNPGGPGGSGVGFLLGAGPSLQMLVGSPEGLEFDHVSFDPRGIAFTTPRVECFKDPSRAQQWLTRLLEEGVYSSSDAAFGRLWSMSIAESASCSLPPKHGKTDIKQYVNTAFVARDMLEIVERHGEWREAEATRLLRDSLPADIDAANTLEMLKYRPGNEKINYWGFSYGTYLGNTFAAMFPDRINRLIVDGVVDAYDYRETLWLDNLVDTERSLDLFHYHCARVGHPKCALANSTGDTTPEGVKDRVNNITTSLWHNPLPIISRQQPEIVTYSDVKGLLFMSLYSPIPMFPIAASILEGIERGVSHINEAPNLLAKAAEFGVQGPQMAIACSDGESQNGVSKEEFRSHVENLEKLSPNLGEIWAAVRLECIHYKVRSHYRFTADWTGNTSHPIMEIGNTADPVTPGRYAKKMAKGFTGAVALIQDSPGHCSLSAPSNCTATYIRQYFQTGKLPEEGTVCPVDQLPFDKSPFDADEDMEMDTLNQADRKLRDQLRIIESALYASTGGFGPQADAVRMAGSLLH